MRLNKLFILSVLAALAFLAQPRVAHAEAGGNIDGVYTIRLTPDAASKQTGAREFDEAFTVEGINIQMEVFSAMGFAASDGVLDVTGKTYTATMTSVTRGTLVWQLTFATNPNKTTSGSLTWTREDGRVWKFAMLCVN